MKTSLAEQIKILPSGPGVYFFKNDQDEIIYIGKAINLSARIKSYFTNQVNLSSKTKQLVSRIANLDFIAMNSEQEALITECDMIKKYHPRYNIQLRDNKTFPYLKITINEDWPSIYITRHQNNDGAEYFGPFASASSIRRTMQLTRKIFHFRTCTKNITGKDTKPCLDYYIKRCCGPCIGAVSKEKYRDMINHVILFLNGKQELIVHDLITKMRLATQELHFEQAALLRDQLQSIKQVMEGQKISTALRSEQDIIAMAQDKEQACVQIFLVRNNKLVGREHFILDNIRDESPQQMLTEFIKQYYVVASHIPPLILLQYPINEMSMLSNWLTQQKERKVNLKVCRRGDKRNLINMAADNARMGLLLARAKHRTPEAIDAALRELKDKLQLPAAPVRIEGYDISDIQGTSAVGSIVVMEKGTPVPKYYRRFRINTVRHPNDYAMLKEILRRRLQKGTESKNRWAILPDLILIDGGKGQLNAALEIMGELEINNIPLASIAKENEEVFIPSRFTSVNLAKDSLALHLLQQVRDEAHRFAVTYHRSLHSKENIWSALDRIRGIGPKRKRELLKTFGSIDRIRLAPAKDLTQIKGITPILARNIKTSL